MNLAELRIEGTEEALVNFCNQLDVHATSTWKTGDPRRGGKFFTSCGMNVEIADADNPGAMLFTIRDFLARCAAKNITLSDYGLTGELALGVTVGDSVQFVAGIGFSAADLLSLGTLEAELSFTAYPTSDEQNEDAF
jgi:hypothetical protein